MMKKSCYGLRVKNDTEFCSYCIKAFATLYFLLFYYIWRIRKIEVAPLTQPFGHRYINNAQSRGRAFILRPAISQHPLNVSTFQKSFLAARNNSLYYTVL